MMVVNLRVGYWTFGSVTTKRDWTFGSLATEQEEVINVCVGYWTFGIVTTEQDDGCQSFVSLCSRSPPTYYSF